VTLKNPHPLTVTKTNGQGKIDVRRLNICSVYRDFYEVVYQRTNRDLGVKLTAGAIAGISGTSIIYPIDVIKTKIQSSKEKGMKSK